AGAEDRGAVAGPFQVRGEADDVVLHTARLVEGVRADQPDPAGGHDVTPPGSGKNGWYMCQSSGRWSSSVAKKSQTSWVISTRPARPGRCGTGSPSTTSSPGPPNRVSAGMSAAPLRRATTAGPAGRVIATGPDGVRQRTGSPVPARSRSPIRQTIRPE